MTKDAKPGKSKQWRPQTMMVRGGTTRSQYGETSEALYLNSGFVYDSPEEQSARMAGDAPGYIYSRYANPTVRMFEERLAQLVWTRAPLVLDARQAAGVASSEVTRAYTLPNPVMDEDDNRYVPRNMPAIGDLMEMFNFGDRGDGDDH